jgi:hypothetical protein
MAAPAFLTPLLPLQRLIIPALLLVMLWAVWRTVFRRDFAVGLALYIALLVIVDGFLNTGLYLPGLDKGSIRYSELWALILIVRRPSAAPRDWLFGAACIFAGIYFSLLLRGCQRCTSFARRSLRRWSRSLSRSGG